MSTFATGTGDATAARVRTELKIFTDWCTANGVKGHIGEYGWPASSLALTDVNTGSGMIYDQQWDAVAQQWYLDANAANLWLTSWCTGEWGIDMKAYLTHDGNNRQFDYRSTVSSVLEANYTTGGTGVLRGTNYVGGEFSAPDANGSLFIGSYAQPGAAYYYPTAINWQVLYNRGVRLVRLPFRWERLQKTLKGALDTNDLAMLKASIQAAGAAGIQVMIDMHNYGRYDADGTNSHQVYDLGQNAPATHRGATVGGTMIDCYVDVCTKLATALKGVSGYWGFDIMNEPHDLTGNVNTWQTASRQVTEAIRAIDTSCYIVMPGYQYNTVPGWTSSNGSTAWLTGTIPAGQPGAGSARNLDPKLLFSGHHYYDGSHAGQYTKTYAQELTDSQNGGYTSYSNGGYTAPATNNTSQTGPRIQSSSSMDSAGDFDTPTGGANFVNSNTVTIPYAADGNPGNSLRVSYTATNDEGGVRRSMTTAQGRNIRTAYLDVKVPTGSALPTTLSNNFSIMHTWNNDYSTDLLEIRMIGKVGGGYTVGLTIPGGAYVFNQATTPTVLALGAWNTLRLDVTNAAFNLYINGNATPEVSLAASNTGVNIGGLQIGKFYSTAYVGDILFDNYSGTINVTAISPPAGGFLTQIGGAIASLIKSLGFFS